MQHKLGYFYKFVWLMLWHIPCLER